MTIIYEKDFVQHLDDWLFKNAQTDASWLNSKKLQIPLIFRNHASKLYRGMRVSKDFLEKSEITFQDHTSWTTDKALAEKFAKDKQFSFGKKSGDIPILISKTIPSSKQILDIGALALFMDSQLVDLGMDETSLDSAKKESEVLVEKGIRIKKGDIKLL